MLRGLLRRNKTEKKQKKRRKVGGKRVKTQVVKSQIRREDSKSAVPKQRSIVKPRKPKTKQSAITPTEVAMKMKTTKGGKRK